MRLLVTLHYHATQNLIKAGVKKDFALELVTDLMNKTNRNLRSLSHTNALTGPIQRGDVETVSRHIKALSYSIVSQNIYTSLGRGTLPLTSNSEDIKHKLETEFTSVFKH